MSSRIRNGAQLDAMVFPPLRYAVPGIIPEGMGLFVGPPKVGKSWAVLGVSLALATGGVAFGGIEIGHPRRVLHLALEDGERRFQDRSRQLLGPVPIPSELDYITASLDQAGLYEEVGSWLADYPQGTVVLDTLGKVLRPANLGETQYERDCRAGGVLKALSDAHPGSTVVVVHHARKARADDFVDAVSGTNGLAGAADFVIVVTRPRMANTAVMRVTGRDVIEQEYALDVAGGRWQLVNGSVADAMAAAASLRVTDGLGGRSRDICEYVRHAPEPVTAGAVAQALGLDANATGTYLRRLVDAGRLERYGRGLFGLHEVHGIGGVS